VDIWAVGCILYYLLCGKPPFASLEDIVLEDMYRRIRANKYSVPAHVSPLAEGVIRRLLSPSPGDRPTAGEAMKYEFFQNAMWSRASNQERAVPGAGRNSPVPNFVQQMPLVGQMPACILGELSTPALQVTRGRRRGTTVQPHQLVQKIPLVGQIQFANIQRTPRVLVTRLLQPQPQGPSSVVFTSPVPEVPPAKCAKMSPVKPRSLYQ
jgi:serine/threonine protein kinase